MKSSYNDCYPVAQLPSIIQSTPSRPEFDIYTFLGDPTQRESNIDDGDIHSPQGSYYVALPKHRRKRQAWTDEETKKLLKGVHLFGKGNWAIIHQQMQFSDTRTTTDIKDKWRNLVDPRKNARTPKELKKLAIFINHEQDSVPSLNRAIYSFIPQPNGNMTPVQFKEGTFKEPPAQTSTDGRQQPTVPIQSLIEIPEVEISNQAWESMRYNEDWSN